jgi:hypothetical protein
VAYAIQVESMKDEEAYDEFVVNLPLHPDAPKRTSKKTTRRLMALMGMPKGPRQVAGDSDAARPPRRKRPVGGSGE